ATFKSVDRQSVSPSRLGSGLGFQSGRRRNSRVVPNRGDKKSDAASQAYTETDQGLHTGCRNERDLLGIEATPTRSWRPVKCDERSPPRCSSRSSTCIRIVIFFPNSGMMT